MKTCPNCGVNVNRNAVYCRICGSSADGRKVGDFATQITNLFCDENGYYYVYMVGGIQQVIKGDTVDEVKSQARRRNFPWISKGESVKKTGQVKASKEIKNPFLDAGAQKTDNVNERYKLSGGHYDVYIPRVADSKVKRNPSKSREIPYDQLPRDFGVVGLCRKERQGRTQWAFKTNETNAAIYNDRLESLRDDVISRELNWDVVDRDAFMKSLEKDELEKKRRTDEILKKRGLSVSFEEKKKLNNGLKANTSPTNGNSTRLDRMFR